MLFRFYVSHYTLGIKMCLLEILFENLKNIACRTSHRENYIGIYWELLEFHYFNVKNRI